MRNSDQIVKGRSAGCSLANRLHATQTEAFEDEWGLIDEPVEKPALDHQFSCTSSISLYIECDSLEEIESSLFRTMKYTPVFPSKPFKDLDAARDWIYSSVHWYNEEHRLAGFDS